MNLFSYICAKMKLINNNISPLPFYESLDLRNHRKDYSFGQVYNLVIYRNVLMPFQVILPYGSVIGGVSLYKHGNDVEFSQSASGAENITKELIAAGLKLKAQDDGSVSLIYPGYTPLLSIKSEGRYSMLIRVLSLGQPQLNLYSEIFTSSNNVSNCIHLEYSNSYPFRLKGGIIDFLDDFKFSCYLATEIGKPEYNFEEEATERMGYSFIESQVSKKTYRFVFVAPEYLCDALRIVRLCDTKTITDAHSQVYDLTNFNMSVDWEVQGDLASVECSFDTDTVIANIGGYDTSEITNGDFNLDFNTDFNNL